jgi:hypothetical protein
MTCIEHAPICHQAELESLLTRRFQTFRAVSVIDARPHTFQKLEEESLKAA